MKLDHKNDAIISKLKISLKSEFNFINENIDSLTEIIDCQDNEIIKNECELLKAYKIDPSCCLDTDSMLLKEITLINSLKSHLEMLNESASRFSLNIITANINPFINKILKGISIASNKLWQLLSHIASLKEWSLEGDVSANANFGVFALNGGVKLRLSFN